MFTLHVRQFFGLLTGKGIIHITLRVPAEKMYLLTQIRKAVAAEVVEDKDD